MPSRKQIVLWGLAIVLLGIAGIYQGFFRYSSTHHASVILSLPEGAASQNQRIADFERVLTLLETWAPTAGFAKVGPEGVGSMRQSWFSSGGKGNAKIVYYTEQSPKDRSFPTEIMTCFDPDGLPTVQITMAEGYHRKPTAKLQTVHADLQRLMTDHFPERVTGGIW